jgi:hypothetical protein
MLSTRTHEFKRKIAEAEECSEVEKHFLTVAVDFIETIDLLDAPNVLGLIENLYVVLSVDEGGVGLGFCPRS